MKIILITGVGRGLGAALAKRLLEEPEVRVIGTSRSGNPDFSHARLRMLNCDVAAENADFSEILNELGENQLDGIINNAAVLKNTAFGKYENQELESIFRVNLFGPFRLLQSLAHKLKPGSHVVNIGSMGGFQGSMKFPGLSAYSASKGALAILSECLAEEWKAADIRVNCLALGSVNTEMLAEAFPGYTAPLNPDRMADFISKFCLEGHQFFNGKIIPVSVSVP